MTLDPAFNVPCPTCYVKAGQPCRSRHAVSIHQGRRQALADLDGQAARLAAADRRKPPQRKPERQTVMVGVTGTENTILDSSEDWPPWEEPPVYGCLALAGMGVVGSFWCPHHREYEELGVMP